MSVRLFKTTEGKILMSSGKLIKQPYEIGGAFCNKMGLNNYFEATGLNINKGWSFLSVIKINDDTNFEGWMQLVSTSLNLADNITSRLTKYSVNLIDNTLTVHNANNLRGNPLYMSLTDNSDFLYGASLKSISNTVTEGIRDKIRIGASGTIGNNSLPVTYYLSESNIFNKLYIFNRKLSLTELVYFRNNLLYNDLLSRLGLMHEFDLSKVEIINVDGIDNVCARDLAGGRHAKLMNLPAGTLQQKLDFANANLFVPFQ